MPEEIRTQSDSLWMGLTAGFTSFMNFVPALLGAALLLVIGWYIAKLVAKLVERVLIKLNFENIVERTHVSDYLPPTEKGAKLRGSSLIGMMAKWFVFLIFVQAAANILHMEQVTAIINSIVLFIPNLVVALAILILGLWIARFASGIVAASTEKMGVGSPNVFAMITRYAIIGFAAIAAVSQIGVATNLINILFSGLVASLALAFGLSFGLGGQSIASDITKSWYSKGPGASGRSTPGGAGVT